MLNKFKMLFLFLIRKIRPDHNCSPCVPGLQTLFDIANNGNSKAQCALGAIYDLGIGVTKDYKKAINWYTKAAEQGIAEAQHNLGAMYHKGRGVFKDYKKAVNWYTKAAEQGITESQFNLGFMYQKGKGVIKNYKEAFNWYIKAAEHGNTNAQVGLAGMYLYGKGVSEDIAEAYKWLLLADMNGADITKNKQIISLLINPSQIDEAKKRTKEYVAMHDVGSTTKPPDGQTQLYLNHMIFSKGYITKLCRTEAFWACFFEMCVLFHFVPKDRGNVYVKLSEFIDLYATIYICEIDKTQNNPIGKSNILAELQNTYMRIKDIDEPKTGIGLMKEICDKNKDVYSALRITMMITTSVDNVLDTILKNPESFPSIIEDGLPLVQNKIKLEGTLEPDQ